MRCINKSNLQLFQKALLMNINGARKLLTIVQEYGLKYLLTTKSNQDALENLFGQVRTRGGLNDHSSPLNALYRLRMIVLGKNPGVVLTSSNTNDENQEEFMVITKINIHQEHWPTSIGNIGENSIKNNIRFLIFFTFS